MKRAAFTIISKNYLAYARVLTNSLLRFHSDMEVYVFLADRSEGYVQAQRERFRLVGAEEIGIPNFEQFSFKYTILEFNTAIKPSCIEYLFRKLGYAKILYFDPDILVTQNLEQLFRELDSASILLTPHITQAISDSKRPNEIDFLLSGSYNLGFIGLADTPTTHAFVRWWKNRVYDRCLHKVDAGLFVDQKWIDLAPSIFDGVRILKDPGLNVAYWNLAERPIILRAGSVEDARVREKPLSFFHFSGFEPENPSSVSKHQTRFSLDDLPMAKPLFLHYRDLLFSSGYQESKAWPYAYGQFDNGVPIPTIVRRVYHALPEAKRASFGDPFATDHASSFFEWLNTPQRPHDRLPAITHFWYALYRSEPSLMQIFPDIFTDDGDRFAAWVRHEARHRYHLPDAFILPLEQPRTPTVRLHTWGYRTRMWAAEWKRLLTMFPAGRINRMYYHPTLQRYKFSLRRRIGDDWYYAAQQRIAPIVWRWTRAERSPPITPRRAEPKKPPADGLNIVGHVRAESGVGEAARSIITSCLRANIPHKINALETNIHRKQDATIPTADVGNPYDVNIVHVNADQAESFFALMGKKYFDGKYTVGYWLWEQSEFPERYHHTFSLYDEIWTASAFSHQALAAVSPIPVVRMPLAVERTPQTPFTRKELGVAPDAWVFLYMFDVLSFVERKNPFGVIAAFARAFSSPDRATLVIKVMNGEHAPDVLQKLRTLQRSTPFRLLNSTLPRDDVSRLLQSCDCYVSLHRAEGFGLTMAEAMAFGKPVIATAYSGNLDFMRPHNSFGVNYSLVRLTHDVGPYRAGTVWAEPDTEHAASLMRRVYEDRKDAERVGAQAARDIRTHFSPGAVGTMIQQRLEVIGPKRRMRAGRETP